MKKKIDLLFGFLYFGLILLGYTGTFFTSISDVLFGNSSKYIFYYEYLVVAIENIFRLIIYIIGAFCLYFFYRKFNKSNDEKVVAKEKLSVKKKFVLYSITLITITIVSIISGWQLKVLTDLGNKYNIYEVYVKLSEIAAFVIEIYLLCLMLFHFDRFTESNFKNYKYFSFSVIFILFTYSIYSLIVDFTVYQFIFIPFTVSLGFIYPYTERRVLITYLITLLVFLF